MALVPDLSIVIPAYNEEPRLGATVRGAVDFFRSEGRAFELIVVDDGSRDGTSALARRLCDEMPEVRLIRLAANHGKGYAVRTGVVNARGRAVLFADADGATPFAEIERLEAALEAGADVAIGSRARSRRRASACRPSSTAASSAGPSTPWSSCSPCATSRTPSAASSCSARRWRTTCSPACG